MNECSHPVGVEPAELRYREFEQQVHANPALNATLPCMLSNETWMDAYHDQVLDAPPNSGVDSWWTDGTCDGGTYGGDWYETRTHKPVPTSPAFSCTCTP